MRATAGRFEALSGEPTDELQALLADFGATMRPIFGPTEERILAESSRLAAVGEPVDLAVFYKVDAPPETFERLRDGLIRQEVVEAAYVKPGAEPAAILNDMAPASEEAPPSTPDFTARQGYLDTAPGGVEARWAWTQAGGRGRNIRIIDIEGAWRFTHEDLRALQGGVVGGTESADIRWRNHGTAVLGEYSGDVNGFGITGIASDATASAISIFGGMGSAGAINAAAARLQPGDIILIELHRPGPRFGFAGREDQRGYIAIEWWPDDFAAIRAAVNRGIIVVEAAGNGAENLDDAIYQTPAPGFPSGWTNPFRRSNRDSGAIVVGAGAPPPGTHGRNHGPDRSRLDFSNWGALIDAQGWGREVTTCGYGDLQGGSNEDLWYTDTFSGTSSASPIVVGVCAVLQGMARARGLPPITPAQMRHCLRTTGSPQQDAPGRPATQRIGNRPNLRELVTCLFGKGKEAAKDLKDSRKDLKDKEKEGKETAKDIKDLKEGTKDGKEKESKELKEKDKEKEKDIKEVKEKDFKEVKEGKDLIKDGKEREKNIKEKDKDKDLVEGGINRDRVIVNPAADVSTETRLAALEAAVGQLLHFIGVEHRPDLTGTQQLTEEERIAKQEKDLKDREGY